MIMETKHKLLVLFCLIILFIMICGASIVNQANRSIVLIPKEQLPQDFSFSNYTVAFNSPLDNKSVYVDGDGNLSMKIENDQQASIKYIRIKKQVG